MSQPTFQSVVVGTHSHRSLTLLRAYGQLFGLNLDVAQLDHEFGTAAEVNPQFTVSDMIKALQDLGFDARQEAGSLHKLRHAHLPAFVLDKNEEFMIVGEIDAQQVMLHRAGQAEHAMHPIAEFETCWSGQWIEAQRVGQVVQADRLPERQEFGIRWFWQALRKYKTLLGEIMLASFFVQIFALISPLIFQVVIDKVLTHRSLSTLDVMAFALLVVSIFEILLGAMRHYLFSHTTNRIDVELGSKLFKQLMHLPLDYFESRRSGDTVARMHELENARNFMTGQALTGCLDLFFAIVFLSVMCYYSPMLTLIVVLFLPVFFAASKIITPLMQRKLEDKFAMGADNQAFLVETITAMETLKTQAVEPHWQREWERRLADYVNVSFDSGHLSNATNQFSNFASKLMTVMLLWFGSKAVIDGDLTVGGLIAFNMLSGRVNAPILKLASLWQEFTQMKVSISRLADIMDAQAEQAFQPGRVLPPVMQGRVIFERVSFNYPNTETPVLKEVTFNISPGEIVGIVGMSGAGKTTLTRLISRLYAPTQGRVLIDDVDLKAADTSWLRRQVGVVAQDMQLFNRSVRENIAFANLALTIEEVMQAAKLAGAHEFIQQLPQGYDTVIGERGSKLSGGQRARIAIARALVTNPRLLLLDEATAWLDYESERLIHENMAQITKGRTVFIVAHRLPTLHMANRILVLEQGRLIEQGSHEQLVMQNGRYAALFAAHQVLYAPEHNTHSAKEADHV